MADLAKIENTVSEFNKKYGVDFSITDFDEKLNDKADAKAADERYKTTFTELYKKAFANFIDLRIGDRFDFGEMIREFEKGIMVPYRTLCGTEKMVPMPYGGWRGKEYLKAVEGYLNDQVPSRKTDFAADRYMKGELRIRDMRAHAEQLMAGEKPSLAQLSTLKCYAEALKEVNMKRSFAWKLLHPIRNSAEQSAASQFEAYIEKTIGKESADLSGNSVTEDHSLVRAFASNDIIDQAKRSVQNTVAKLEGEEKNTEVAKVKDKTAENIQIKTKLIVKEAVTNENFVQSSGQLRKSEVLEKSVLNLNDI